MFMNPGRYFIPNMNVNPAMIRSGYGITRSTGFLERMIRGIRTFDWGKLLNGANKTLNVMNQTIPLVRQAKPMVGNVKSMIKLARAFGSETVNKQSRNTNHNLHMEQNVQKKEINDDNTNYPNFFI